MTVVRTNLGPKLASGAIRPRPGMHGTRPVPREPGPMETAWAAQRIAEHEAEGMDFYAAFRATMEDIRNAH